jgi:hypothetical protein
MAGDDSSENMTIPTYISCSDCHKQQVAFWQKTAHSLAFTTLIHDKAQNNPSCIKCHSVGMNIPGGFTGSRNLVSSDNKNFNIKNYWKELNKTVPFEHPVRDLSPKKRQKIAKLWLKHDTKSGVQANYSNVQCLNCHNQNLDHPFGEKSIVKVAPVMQKCLACHTQDQSPSWYDKDAKGLASSLNKSYFSKKLEQVSCPKIEKE